MINSVRNTVLSVLNKNNYGYISPSDFNLYAQQAQMEFYDEYFSSINKVINAENARTSGTEYANLGKTYAEVLETFLISDFLFPIYTGAGNTTNRFTIPTLTTVGNESYMIDKVLCYTNRLSPDPSYTDATALYQLIDSFADFIAAGVSPGDIVLNAETHLSTTVVEVIDETTLSLNEDIFVKPTSDEEYSIYAAKDFSEADKVTDAKITMLSVSSLTTPSNTFPAYTQIGEVMKMYPTNIAGYGAVQAFYFRYPKPPKWTYTTILGGEPVFDQTQPDYQDFELPQEDEYKLAVKILAYCGISIREIEVTQFALGQEQHEQPSFSQKQ